MLKRLGGGLATMKSTILNHAKFFQVPSHNKPAGFQVRQRRMSVAWSPFNVSLSVFRKRL
ncbi:MAG: hypothetical protein IKP99_06095 [Bacteroidales bacterium]|nr:hypothetical protein [Bacteroidales bacterium]